ncbi:hypothetical protein T05_5176 [Trichinella murrelli]|uniref:Transmembrane protein n=1 Tax=Trichinella murrelli TaxID=144512 RepID=A0A0V0TVD5_9BILA|nr:hypothetical protein T05_5176 [Trichinella murrelli]
MTVEHNCTCTSCRHFCRTSSVGDTKSAAGDCVRCGCYSVFVISSLLFTLFCVLFNKDFASRDGLKSRSADERYISCLLERNCADWVVHWDEFGSQRRSVVKSTKKLASDVVATGISTKADKENNRFV